MWMIHSGWSCRELLQQPTCSGTLGSWCWWKKFEIGTYVRLFMNLVYQHALYVCNHWSWVPALIPTQAQSVVDCGNALKWGIAVHHVISFQDQDKLAHVDSCHKCLGYCQWSLSSLSITILFVCCMLNLYHSLSPFPLLHCSGTLLKQPTMRPTAEPLATLGNQESAGWFSVSEMCHTDVGDEWDWKLKRIGNTVGQTSISDDLSTLWFKETSALNINFPHRRLRVISQKSMRSKHSAGYVGLFTAVFCCRQRGATVGPWSSPPGRCFAAIDSESVKLQQRRYQLKCCLKSMKFPPPKTFTVDGKIYPLPLKTLKTVRPPPGEPSREELEYLAGFFDGDGCVTMSDRSIVLSVSQSIDSARVLLRFCQAFGGGVCLSENRHGWWCFKASSQFAAGHCSSQAEDFKETNSHSIAVLWLLAIF